MNKKAVINIDHDLKLRFYSYKRDYEYAIGRRLTEKEFFRILLDSYENYIRMKKEGDIKKKLEKFFLKIG